MPNGLDCGPRQTMSSKTKIIYILLAVVLLALIVIIVMSLTKKAAVPNITAPNPTSAPQPTNTIQHKQQFSTPLKGEAVDTFVTQVTTPKQLSSTDADIRNAFISQADNSTHIIHQTSLYTFLYAPGADLFQVEINSEHVTQTEEDAVSWLLGEGLTQQGICNLPVIFFRDPKQFNNGQTTGLEIYPQPDFCQK